jgi:hypothetical protein
MFMLCVPVERGKSRLFITSRKLPFPFSAFPIWLKHSLSSRFVDTDVWLHDTELAALATKPKPLKYLLPTSSDLGCIAFRNWWRNCGMAESKSLFGAPPPSLLLDFSSKKTSRGEPTAASMAEQLLLLPKAVSRSEMLDRKAYHVDNCAACSQALATATSVHKGALPAAALLVLALGGESSAVPLFRCLKSVTFRVGLMSLALAVRAVAGKAVRAIGGAAAAGDSPPRRSEAAD